MRDVAKDKEYQTKRAVRGVVGMVLTVLGVFVAVKEPSGSLVALFLVGVGCGMIDPAIVKRTFKSVVPKPGE